MRLLPFCANNTLFAFAKLAEINCQWTCHKWKTWTTQNRTEVNCRRYLWCQLTWLLLSSWKICLMMTFTYHFFCIITEHYFPITLHVADIIKDCGMWIHCLGDQFCDLKAEPIWLWLTNLQLSQMSVLASAGCPGKHPKYAEVLPLMLDLQMTL